MRPTRRFSSGVEAVSSLFQPFLRVKRLKVCTASVGLFAVQLAAIAGLRVITTCSPRNAELVRSLGASEVFDYHDPDVVDKIRAAAPGMRYAFDTIGDGDTSTLSSRALASNEQVYLCTVRPGKAFTENVTANTIVSDVLVWTAFLKDHSYRGQIVYPVSSTASRRTLLSLARKTRIILSEGLTGLGIQGRSRPLHRAL